MLHNTPQTTVRTAFIFFFSLLLLVAASCGRGTSEASYTPDEKEALALLDEAVARRPEIFRTKEATLDSLRASLSYAASDSLRAELYERLTEAYLSYQFDSAFKYVRLRNELLGRLDADRHPEKAEGLLQEILVLTSAGLFNESTDLIDEVDTVALPSDIREHALWVSAKTNYDLYAYTKSIKEVDNPYRAGVLNLGSKLAETLPETGWEPAFVRGHVLVISEDAPGAAAAFEEAIADPAIPRHARAMAEGNLGDLYDTLGDKGQSLIHYARSALIDLRSATRENTSLLKLSSLLLEKGDLGRSYAYARAALEDANFYNAYHRKIAVGDVLPLIESQRYALLDRQKNTLTSGLALVLFLCLLLIALSVVIFRQVKKLRKANATIAEQNAGLSAVNKELALSNAIKDEYIGLSFSNDSAHIKKLEGLYRFVANKLRDKKYAEIKSAFDPSQLQKERESMYENFDATFLRLFPGFIDRYNALFPAEEQAQPASGRLTTEMRIFALIRLGINKSDDIAAFLDYSVNTINTYKTRVKNKSLVDNGLFEEAIHAIDSAI